MNENINASTECFASTSSSNTRSFSEATHSTILNIIENKDTVMEKLGPGICVLLVLRYGLGAPPEKIMCVQGAEQTFKKCRIP